ncbi:hypothetical protein CEXT_117351 [Caerostris extrusa]|uniref:Uncharacterized protein n=1 Tax=Caerostris extrusa TaxID=172846 RepID=A0AAV4XE01_CAEEX|nr:hypothetical protein CEXT_117351 [Caerostris extrusa]
MRFLARIFSFRDLQKGEGESGAKNLNKSVHELVTFSLYLKCLLIMFHLCFIGNKRSSGELSPRGPICGDGANIEKTLVTFNPFH